MSANRLWRRWSRHSLSSCRPEAASSAKRPRPLRLERLEDRRLLTAYAVDSLDDVYYPDPGSYPVDGFVTLREALEAANTNTQVGDAAPGSGLETDLVEFDADLFIGEPATITLAGRELEIAGDVDVQGPGLDQLAIDADDQSRVFYVGAGIEAAISGLVLIGGFIDDGEAGGGGIFNAGTLTVTDSTISGNSAEDAGGVYNTGTLTVTNSTLSGNSASRFGGGILNFHAGTLTVANSTLGGNTASSGGGIYSSSAELTVTNSIVALNTAFSDPDVRGSAAPPSGFHLIGTDPMFVRNPSAGTDGIWGTADDDFGDLRLRFDSPAIDAGDPSFDPDAFEPSLTTDQGGNPRILDGDDNGSEIVDLGAYEYAPSVVGSYLYYRGSRFDFGPGDNAVATDKRPLIAGQTATAANYSNYDAGINGLMIDVNRPDDGYEFSADDFVFRLGNDDNPAGWQLAPPPTQIVTRPGLGVGGSIRVNVVWENDAVKNTWLQVTVPANEDTDLLEDEVFYFGNAAGETGNDPAGGLVNAADIIGARDNPHGLLNLAPITDPFDFNRDRRIDAVDMIMARNNATSPFNALRLITGDTQPVYTFAAGISQGNLEDSETRDEISGLAVGISNPAVLWGVNDGTSTGLFAIGLDGSDLGTWTLSGVSVTDVEDMAAATVGGANYLYVGDIGDNNAVRSTINILRFEEPTGSPGSRRRQPRRP